jgi:ankyrin repeat protein
MKSRLRFLALSLLLALIPACSTVPKAGNNDAVIAAVKAGNSQEVRRLLDGGMDVNGRDRERSATPLHWAAFSGSTEVGELLIARGADVNAKDRSGFTPLHFAAYQDDRAVAELLIRSGAQVNAGGTAGITPLQKAIERLALSNATSHQVSPSDVAATSSVVELLLASGADVNGGIRSLSPLFLAVASGQKALVELLIDKGANIAVKGDEDVTPLYMATKTDSKEIAELLIARGAEVDPRTKSGYTPLLWAAHQGNKDLAELLIAHGANVNSKDIQSRTPLVWALLTASFSSPSGQTLRSKVGPAEQEEVQKELKDMKGQWHEVAMLLIDHGADSSADSQNNSPLQLAATLGDKTLVEALIDHGADLNEAKAGETALHAALAERHGDVAALLINRGANVNAGNMSQRTPLHFLAAFMDDPQLAELMIQHGADVNARDKNRQTPLMLATRAGNNQVAEVLRQHGGN